MAFNWVPKFHMGLIVTTPTVQQELSVNQSMELIRRHGTCDWGDLCNEDKALNDMALNSGDRIFSSYGDYYVITEWDRSVTTILRKDEY